MLGAGAAPRPADAPLEEPVLTRRFFVYTRAQRSLSPAAEAFIACFVRVRREPGPPR
jgi:DNA-binding transcriptional LysR family regulator